MRSMLASDERALNMGRDGVVVERGPRDPFLEMFDVYGDVPTLERRSDACTGEPCSTPDARVVIASTRRAFPCLVGALRWKSARSFAAIRMESRITRDARRVRSSPGPRGDTSFSEDPLSRAVDRSAESLLAKNRSSPPS